MGKQNETYLVVTITSCFWVDKSKNVFYTQYLMYKLEDGLATHCIDIDTNIYRAFFYWPLPINV